ncbi:MAG: hypothetical protein ACI4KR_12435 [Ruminiclostridium sp.]
MEAESFEEHCPEGVLGSEKIHRFYDDSFKGIRLDNACFTYHLSSKRIQARRSDRLADFFNKNENT